MGVQSLYGERAAGSSDLLAIGFGTTVAMWAVGYVGHMPLTDVPPVVFVTLMLACLVAGGWVVGSKTRRGIAGGLGLGLIVALLNLMILGSTLRRPIPARSCPRPGSGCRAILSSAWRWRPPAQPRARPVARLAHLLYAARWERGKW